MGRSRKRHKTRPDEIEQAQDMAKPTAYSCPLHGVSQEPRCCRRSYQMTLAEHNRAVDAKVTEMRLAAKADPDRSENGFTALWRQVVNDTQPWLRYIQ